MLCIPQFEKTWNKGKAKVLQQEALVTNLFMDNKTLYFLKINTAVIQQQSFTLSINKYKSHSKPIQCGFLILTKVMQSTVRIVTKHLKE